MTEPAMSAVILGRYLSLPSCQTCELNIDAMHLLPIPSCVRVLLGGTLVVFTPLLESSKTCPVPLYFMPYLLRCHRVLRLLKGTNTEELYYS